MIIPKALPDEALISLLARFCLFNGFQDAVAAMSWLSGRRQTSFVGAEIDLNKFVSVASECVGASHRSIDRLTTVGALISLGEMRWLASANRQSRFGTSRMGDLTFSGLVRLRFCTSCRQNDIERYGMSYWHRQHLYPFTHVCAVHRKPLVILNARRADLHDGLTLPSKSRDLSNTGSSDVGIPGPFAYELADVLMDCTNGDVIEELVIHATIVDALVTRGFGTRSGMWHANALTEFLRAKIIQLGTEVSSPGAHVLARQVVAGLRGRKWLPFTHGILIASFFSSWRAFVESARWFEVLGIVDTRESEVLAKRNAKVSAVTGHRDNCLDFVAAYPRGSRSDFARHKARSFRWLLHYDRPWFDEVLPANYVEQIRLF